MANVGEAQGTNNDTIRQEWSGRLREGILEQLENSATQARHYAAMADKERAGQPLTDKNYEEIQNVAQVAEQQFNLFKSLGNDQFALSIPDPMMKVADVFGGEKGLLEAAVARPMEWDQIVPFFGRRQIVIGAVYGYNEFISHSPYSNEDWRKAVDTVPPASWVRPFVAPKTCGSGSR
jgi:hypothetical protein